MQAKTSVTFSERGSPLYLSEKERFLGSFVEEERERRNLRQVFEKERIERKRKLLEELLQRRKEFELRKQEIYLKRLEFLHEKGDPKNEGSMPFNPLTLEYASNLEGQLLKYQDDKIIYRAKLRAHKLYFEQNRNGFNPITGEDNISARLPDPPLDPRLAEI